jgi:polyvinyl alcohol dehydrogenase (cytochrome)
MRIPWLALGALVVSGSVTFASPDPGLLLYATEGNRLRRFDVDTVGTASQLEDVLVEQASAAESGGGNDFIQGFRDSNGVVCRIPDGSGRMIWGEDTGQPNPPAGWGVFEPDGTQVGKLTATYFTAGPEPFGCAFTRDGLLFTVEVGAHGFGDANGQLIMWFPPYDHFPGPPGAFPNSNAPSTNFCKIATDIGTAASVAIDDEGRVYVASASQLSIFRFLPPFPTGPDAAGGCGASDALGSPMADVVNRETFRGPIGISAFTGLAFAPNGNLYASSVFTGDIWELDASGAVVRQILDPPEALPPVSTGNPQSLAVGPDGTIYYADLALVGTLPNVGPGPNGKVRRIRFDGAGNPLPPEIVREGLRFPDGVALHPGDLQPAQWRTYGGGDSRRWMNPAEDGIRASTVDQLAVKWTFPTGAVVTAPPVVARLDVPGEGRLAVAYVQSWDGNVYAVRLRDGSELWRFATSPHPGASFPHVGAAHVETIDGTERLFIAAGETMHALDAATGAEIWRFEAGTGCATPPGLCAHDGERNEIESSVLVAGGLVVFGMDVDDRVGGKGGLYAVDASDGRLAWFLDLESGGTCRPDAGDDIRRYDGYHTEAELGLPAGFLASRAGCDHPRTPNGCGNVWSSAAADTDRGLLFIASSNCDTDTNPATLQPPPPMPAHDEALLAVDLDGTPVWRWRPREVDNADLAFGATPNLFTAVIAGARRDVVGIGNKDGTYYVLDRDGEHEVTGVRWDDADPSGLPYWATNVVPGGRLGGIVGTPAVDEAAGRIYFATAPGFDPLSPQQPTVHALHADTGAVLWQNVLEGPGADASFAATSVVHGVVFAGGIVGSTLRAYDATDGTKLATWTVGGLGGVATGPAVIDGLVLVGAGTGKRTGVPTDPEEATSNIPQSLTALCIPGTRACLRDRPLAGTRFAYTDPQDAAARRRLLVRADDAAFVPPDAGSDADPTSGGAALELHNPVTAETLHLSLPAARWEALGTPPGAKGYRYVDGAQSDGPCKKVLLRAGRVTAKCRGGGLDFSLDEAAQGEIGVGLQLASDLYCLRFGGVVRDTGHAAGMRRGRFVAKNAPAPAVCPLP